MIIGILAAIAVPKFQNTKGKANAASLRADLRNLVTAEEAYFYDNSAYTTDVSSLNIRMTSGVTITFGAATAGGWSATSHSPACVSDSVRGLLRFSARVLPRQRRKV